MRFGKFDLSIIRESVFKLDGGAMFGVVPKTMWSRTCSVDEDNRVVLACNLLLIDTGDKKVLIETGMGDRWSDKERERYGLKSLVSSATILDQVNLKPEDIDFVVISHLHFDHAGGATMLKDGKLVPVFPNAQYVVQKGEWDFAFKANARAKASYRPDDFVPLQEHNQILFVDGDHEVVPGVWVKITGGHTGHHQIVYFESEAEKGVYFADILPTKSHITPPWVMGYDHYPLVSCDAKSDWLARAVEQNWLVVFDHEPGIPWGRVKVESGKFVFEALSEDSLTFASGNGKALASVG